MLVVSETSPLPKLAVIGSLEVLREQFGTAHMPPAVMLLSVVFMAADRYKVPGLECS